MIGRTNVAMGGSGGAVVPEPKTIINVTTASTELFGKTVTCTDGTESFESVFSDEGTCSFIVNNIATYTITSEGNTATVNVTELGVTYAVTIEAVTQLVNYTMLYDAGDECTDVTGGWSVVKYPGSDSTVGTPTLTKNTSNMVISCSTTTRGFVYCSNEIDLTEYSKVIARINLTKANTVSPNFLGVRDSVGSSAQWIIEKTDFITIGEYFVTNDISSVDAKGYISIFAQKESVTEVYNLFLAKEDNWQEWISKAGLSTATYTTLDSVLSDATALDTLMNSEDAVNYMISKCTGTVIAGAILSETTLDAIANSKYYAKIYGNVHWKKFLDWVGFKTRTYLYNKGVENVAFTEVKWDGEYNPDRATNTKNETSLHTEVIASSSGEKTVFAGWQTDNTVDMSQYSTVKATVKSTGTTSGNIAITPTDLSENIVTGTAIANYTFSTSDEYQTIELDISAITELAYVLIRLYTTSASGYGTLDIEKIWLE